MSDEQLQLFNVPGHPARRPRGLTAPLGQASLRHDHVVLVAMIAMIAASIVFAFGVERGKRVAHTEQSPSIAQALSIPEATMSAKRPETVVGSTDSKASSAPQKQPLKAASASVAGDAQFAIQVVTCRQTQSARRELRQLQQRGENAFLLQRQGKTTVLVGPFPTKENAASKLSALRQRYQDCFLRTL